EDLVEPMRDIDDANAARSDSPDRVEQDLDVVAWKHRGGLVDHEKAGVVGSAQRTRDRDPCALGRRELADRTPSVELVPELAHRSPRRTVCCAPPNPPQRAGVEADAQR